MIKLKRLHKELTHVWSGVGHRHDSSKSLYGYKDYFIKTNDYYMGWNVYKGEEQINPVTFRSMSFKEAREWLENYLKENEEV
jgi:hypothetical protein